MMTYRSKYSLLTPRNGRRKFRSPVQIPSRVLQCTSRTPPPSSSRAHSPRLWLTVACPRPHRASGGGPGGGWGAQVPWPTSWFARRRGGSAGSVCGTPFFPRVLVHLVGLGAVVRQGRAVRPGQGAGLDRVPQFEQVPAADVQLAGRLRRRGPRGDAAEDQEDGGRALVRPPPGRG